MPTDYTKGTWEKRLVYVYHCPNCGRYMTFWTDRAKNCRHCKSRVSFKEVKPILFPLDETACEEWRKGGHE